MTFIIIKVPCKIPHNTPWVFPPMGDVRTMITVAVRLNSLWYLAHAHASVSLIIVSSRGPILCVLHLFYTTTPKPGFTRTALILFSVYPQRLKVGGPVYIKHRLSYLHARVRASQRPANNSTHCTLSLSDTAFFRAEALAFFYPCDLSLKDPCTIPGR
jgi:hypothetical protein